jgi:hypothetical protein
MPVQVGFLMHLVAFLISLVACIIEFRTNKPSDIISTLVSIYDSRDLFIKELQVLLAQRLLAIKDGVDRVEKEVCTGLLELDFLRLLNCSCFRERISRF